MVRLYMELETYRPNVEDAFINERVITAGVAVDRTAYHERSLKRGVEPVLYSEWDGLDEKAIVSEIERTIRKGCAEHRFTTVVGFNILRFDVPLLVAKSGRASQSGLEYISKMWHDCFAVDLMQQLLVANMGSFKGAGLSNVVSTAIRLGLNPPDYPTSGAKVKDLYEAEDYEGIEAHLRQNLRIVRWLDLYGVRRLTEQSVREQRPLFR
jgi:hypothetical protein